MVPSITSDTEELPIAAHIFEGHLYIKDEKTNKWLWRLFRFDGTSLTCLSSKKNKLPPHTMLDNPFNNNSLLSHCRPVSSLTHSASTHSYTSPILATPKHKADRILAGSCSIMESTSDQVSSRNSQPISAGYYQLPKWTIDMINISSISLLKPKQTKSKAFKYSLTTSSSKSKAFIIRTYDESYYILKANKQHDLERWIFVLAKMWKFAQAARQMYGNSIVPQLNHNTTLAAIGSGSTNNLVSIHSTNDQMTSPIQVIQEQHQLPMKALMNSHVGQQQSQQSNHHHHDAMLSNEKALWIEKWVKSLAELETQTPESYCDIVDIVSNEPHINPQYHQQQSARSLAQITDDSQPLRPQRVRNRSSSKQSQITDSSTASSARSKPKKSPTRYNSDYMSYFQDVNTVSTAETNKSKRDTKQPLKYHNSVRARPIRSHTTGHDLPTFFSAAILKHTPQSLEHGCSPLDLLEYKYSQDKLLPSPPATPAAVATAALENDEDVCLADVRKSLQCMDISKRQAKQDAQDEMMAKRRSATLMVNASRRVNDNTNNWYRNSWAPSMSSKNRNSHLFSTAAFT